MLELGRLGETDEAKALWEPLLPLIAALFEEPNPGPLKAILASQGLLKNELRSPMTCASAELAMRVMQMP